MGEVMGLCISVCDWLREQGISCVPGWPGDERGRLASPAVSVQVRQYAVNDSGQINYLGERYDEELSNWVECYGRKVELELALVIYAPETASGEEIQRLADRVAELFSRTSPEGTKVGRITCGATRWEKALGCLSREMTVEMTAWLVAQAGEAEDFLYFELRGGWNI